MSARYAVLGLLAAGACQCQPASEIIPCNGTVDCPNDLVCSNGLCRKPFDAGLVADASSDAMVIDRLAPDRPQTDGAGRDSSDPDHVGRDRQAAADQVPATDRHSTDLGVADAEDRPDTTTDLDAAVADRRQDDRFASADSAPPPDATVQSDAAQNDTASAPDRTNRDAAVPPHWWDRSWQYRIKLTLDNTARSEQLIDFPVLVVLTTASFDFAHAQSHGEDIRFVDEDDQTLLAHEIESWDTAASVPRVAIWVKVPLILASSDRSFVWLYFGNSLATDAQDPIATWNASYQAVWHFTGDHRDSTANANHGAALIASFVSGQIADGAAFNGSSGGITVAGGPSLDDLFGAHGGGVRGGTITAWIKPSGWGEGMWGRIVDKSTSTGCMDGWCFMLDNETGYRSLALQRGSAFMPGFWSTQANSIDLGPWQHVAIALDDSVTSAHAAFYRDGAQLSLGLDQPRSGYDTDDGQPLRIGNRSGADDRTFDGVIDEVRIARGIRSAAWISAEYQSMTDAFITYGSAERRP